MFVNCLKNYSGHPYQGIDNKNPPKTAGFSNLNPLRGGGFPQTPPPQSNKNPPSDEKSKKTEIFFRLRRADVLVPSLL